MSAETNCTNVTQDPTNCDSKELKSTEGKSDKKSHLRSLLVAECGFKITSTENHLKRLQALRKETNFINETDWMYEINDKRSSSSSASSSLLSL